MQECLSDMTVRHWLHVLRSCNAKIAMGKRKRQPRSMSDLFYSESAKHSLSFIRDTKIFSIYLSVCQQNSDLRTPLLKPAQLPSSLRTGFASCKQLVQVRIRRPFHPRPKQKTLLDCYTAGRASASYSTNITPVRFVLLLVLLYFCYKI